MRVPRRTLHASFMQLCHESRFLDNAIYTPDMQGHIKNIWIRDRP